MTSRFIGIQVRTFLAFGAFMVLTLLGAGWGVARYFEAVSRRQIERRQSDTVGIMAAALDDKLFLHLEILQAAARGIPPRAAEDAGTGAAWLAEQRGIRSLFENGIFLVRPDGRVLADPEASARSLPPAILRPFLEAVATAGDGGISEAYRSASSGTPAVMMAVPRLEKDGRVRVLLAGSVDLEHGGFLGAIMDHRMPDTSHLSLLDDRYRILMHPDRSRLLTRATHFEGWIAPSEGPGSGERVDASGTRTLTSVQHLKAVPWTLAAIIPLSQAHAPIARFRSYLKVATVVSILATLVLTWLLSHGLTRNLETFTTEIEAVASQPAGQRQIQTRAKDETGILVDAFNALMARLDRKTERLLLAKAEQDEELALAKHVIQRLVEPGLRNLPPHLRMETLQTLRINGDVCAYQEGLPGIHFGLLCDATGHGLTAGISTLPAIQTFLGMVNRDLPLETIYAEINQKVMQMMPVERFVCLTLLRMDTQAGTLSVLNAGLPDALLCTPEGRCRTFPSRSLPAGILAGGEAPVVETAAMAPGSRLLVFTDGVLDLFASEEARRLLLQGMEACPLEVHEQAIRESLALAIGDQEQHDDVTWALWEMPAPSCALLEAAGTDPITETVALDEHLALELAFSPQRHPVREVLPEVIHLLLSRGLGQRETQVVNLALTEALINAVDHGILGLDSRLKEQGFEAYEALRKLHLAGLQEGVVKLRLHLRTLPSGPLREILIEVEDSGPGFDWRTWERACESPTLAPAGRGLLLIRALSRELSFNEPGNRIRFTLPCG